MLRLNTTRKDRAITRKMRHRGVVGAGIAAALALTLAGCGAGGPQPGSSVTSLTVFVEGGGHGQLQPIADQYEKDTGITITFVELPYEGLYNRMNSELSTGAVSFDVGVIPGVWLPAFKDRLASMDSFFTDEVKADNFPPVLKTSKVEDHFLGVPAWTNSLITYYRTDLFEDAANKAAFEAEFGYELAAPTTWQQYVDMGKFFTKDGNYGIGLVSAQESQYLAAMAQAGQPRLVINEDGTGSNLGDEASLAALDYYTSLVPYAPPGVASADWNAVQNGFYQGQTAMMQFWVHAYRQVPDSSPVHGHIGVAPLPAGPAGVAGVPGAFFLTMPKDGKNQDAAGKFIQYAYDHQALSATTSLGLVSRISVLEEFMTKPGYEAFKPMIETLSAPASTLIPASTRWQSIVADALVPMLQKSVVPGSDNAQLLQEAAQQVESILKQ